MLGLAPERDLSDNPVFQAVTEPYRRCRRANDVQRAQYADLKIYLPNDVLVKVDRMSMAHSLEVRCPLLDRRIVEFAFRVPVATKMPRPADQGAAQARRAETASPTRFSRCPKHGFTAPVAEWLAGPYAARFEAEVLGRDSCTSGLIDQAHVRRLFAEHRAHHAGSSVRALGDLDARALGQAATRIRHRARSR